MLGGNSNGTKFNGKNPVDTNASYRLQFNGGWSYSVSGITSNGTNAYADTFLSGSSVGTFDNHIGVYMNENNVYTGTGKNWIGSSSPTGYGTYFVLGQDGRPGFFYGNKVLFGSTSSGSPQPVGFNIISSTSSSSNKHFYNGVLNFSSTRTNSTNLTSSVVIGALNNDGTIVQYYNNTYSFVTIGLGLSDSDAVNYTNIVNTFNSCLGRNNYPSVTQTPTPTNPPTPTNTTTPTQTPTPTETPVWYQYTVDVYAPSGSFCNRVGQGLKIKTLTPLLVNQYYCSGFSLGYYKIMLFNGTGNDPSYGAWTQVSAGNTASCGTAFLSCPY
jgi:hypothetical protein